MAIPPGPYINWTQIMHGLLKVGTTDCFTLDAVQNSQSSGVLGGTMIPPRGTEEDETEEAGRKKTKRKPDGRRRKRALAIRTTPPGEKDREGRTINQPKVNTDTFL